MTTDELNEALALKAGWTRTTIMSWPAWTSPRGGYSWSLLPVDFAHSIDAQQQWLYPLLVERYGAALYEECIPIELGDEIEWGIEKLGEDGYGIGNRWPGYAPTHAEARARAILEALK